MPGKELARGRTDLAEEIPQWCTTYTLKLADKFRGIQATQYIELKPLVTQIGQAYGDKKRQWSTQHGTNNK